MKLPGKTLMHALGLRGPHRVIIPRCQRQRKAFRKPK
jgi:hypothetical protein